jgi:glutamate-5-semialdehyde dehydrogenase
MVEDEAVNELQVSVRSAHQAALLMGQSTAAVRSQALLRMAKALQKERDEILEANTLDLEASQEMAVPDLLRDWLRLTPERLEGAGRMLSDLATLSNPVPWGNPTGGHGSAYGRLIPLGVIALVYEAMPELGAIAAGLCLRTGNSLVLRGSTEASHTNAVLADVLRGALEDVGLPENGVVLLPSDEGSALRDLVTLDRWINLVIPYGRPQLVQQVVRWATAPVLRTGMGNCYLYWGASGRLDLVRSIVLDSHTSEPDPVSAIEKVLIHQDISDGTLQRLWSELQAKGFELRGDAALVAQFPDLLAIEEMEWGQPYLRRAIAFRRVRSLQEAALWINTHSSGHADTVVSDSYAECQAFAEEVNSAMTYINTSPRFYRNPNHGRNIALGMSNKKGNRRGRIGLETLTTLKQVILGNDS